MRKMFLENGKSIDTSRLSPQILEKFEHTLMERPDAVSSALISKCHDSSERMYSMASDLGNEIKAEFSLYNTFTFLNDDLTASIEYISEHIALKESAVS